MRSAAPDELARVLGAEAAVVGRMVSVVADALPGTGEPLPVPRDAEIARLHDAIGQVLLRLAETAPVLLVVDDLHWADDATVGMLRALSRVALRGRILVIGTYRETDVDRRHPFAQALAILQREVEPTRIALSGLETSDVQTMLERIAEHAVPEELAAMLATETDGNPFFLRETLLHLVEEGQLRFEDGAWSVAGSITDLGLPAGIRDVIGRRLSRLSDATNRLLSAGALFEVAFPLTVAADVAGVEEDEALDAIDAALEARIVRATDTFDEYAFTHALFRHALVEELNPSRQVRMHRAIATALEKQLRGLPTPAQAAALARHYHRSAALPNAEQGVPFALDRGRRRGAALRPARGVRGARRRARALVRRRRARARARPAARRRPRCTRASAPRRCCGPRPRPDELTRLLEGDDAACDFVQNLAAEAAMLDDLRLAWDIGAVARQWLRSDRRDETYLVLRSFELSQAEFDDPDHPGIPLETPERRELIELTRTLPRTSGATLFNPFVGSRAEAQRALEVVASDDGGWVVLGPLWILGAHREMRDILSGRIDDLLARGVIAAAVFDLAVLARLHTVLGEYDDAQTRLDEGFALLPRISETSNPALQLFAAFVLGRTVRGELVASADLAGFAPFGDSPDVRWAWIAVTAFRGHLLAQEGNAGEAIDVLHEVLPVIERAGGWAQNYPALVYSATQILWHLQRTDELETLERNVRTKVVEPDVRYPEAPGRVALAQLCALDGRTDEARHWFDEARRVRRGRRKRAAARRGRLRRSDHEPPAGDRRQLRPRPGVTRARPSPRDPSRARGMGRPYRRPVRAAVPITTRFSRQRVVPPQRARSMQKPRSGAVGSMAGRGAVAPFEGCEVPVEDRSPLRAEVGVDVA